MNLIWILTVVLLTISFAGILVIAKFLTKPFDEERNSFLRMFPFEAKKNSIYNGKPYLVICYIFSILCFAPVLMVIENKGALSQLNFMSILISVILGLSAIVFVFINIFDVTHVKAHINLFTIFAFLVLLSSALIFSRSWVAYKTFNEHGHEANILLVCEILSGIMTILSICVCLNPKLKTWARLDFVEDKKDQYKRPKKFVLAYSEWALFTIIYINEILYLIQLLAK